MYHSPVLLDESIESLEINENGVYVDLTFGGGGHSKEILKNSEFSLGANNLFNQDFYDNIRINAFGKRYYEPAPKRNFYFGINFSF